MWSFAEYDDPLDAIHLILKSVYPAIDFKSRVIMLKELLERLLKGVCRLVLF